MSTKLYSHKTDGGAEYLCTSPVAGTDEGDLYTAIIRLDGEAELLDDSLLVAPELLEALKAILPYTPDWNMPTELYDNARAAIQKAEGK